jgi:hypothetical protein
MLSKLVRGALVSGAFCGPNLVSSADEVGGGAESFRRSGKNEKVAEPMAPVGRPSGPNLPK